jgi:hypothetical protein
MSRDVFVQDIPPDVVKVADIPADFKPRPIADHDELVRGILEAAPEADFSDPDWGTIDADGYSIEIGIKRRDPMYSFAFHVRDATGEADHVIAAILRVLDLRAFDIDAPSGIFVAPEDRPTEPAS